MSIVTRTGDSGTTGLMYNRRVSKCHPRVEAYGVVDELNAALGVARSCAGGEPKLVAVLLQIQADLVVLMGELATAVEDLTRYRRDGFNMLRPEATRRIEEVVTGVEAKVGGFKGWATPGANTLAAYLDMARTICRRAERRVCALSEAGELENNEVIVYLNRVSDLLWLLARAAEGE